MEEQYRNNGGRFGVLRIFTFAHVETLAHSLFAKLITSTEAVRE